MTATQEQAAEYARTLFSPQHTLSWLFANHHDLESGSFSWDVDPSIGDDGEWGMPGEAVPHEMIDANAMRRLLRPLLQRDAIAVFEDPLPRSRPPWDPADVQELRVVFRESDSEVEILLVVDPDGGEAAFDRVWAIAGGAYRFFGIVTPAPAGGLPERGANVTDEQLRELVAGATHMIFRGPSYDAYILWTAGAD